MNMVGHQETPDFEVEADDWADRQKAMQEDFEAAFDGNSCDALRILDGVAAPESEEL